MASTAASRPRQKAIVESEKEQEKEKELPQKVVSSFGIIGKCCIIKTVGNYYSSPTFCCVIAEETRTQVLRTNDGDQQNDAQDPEARRNDQAALVSVIGQSS